MLLVGTPEPARPKVSLSLSRRKLAPSPERNPWTHAAGLAAERTIASPRTVAASWARKQEEIEDVGALMRYEAERANERRADEREKTKAAAREAGADVIDLLSDGDDNGADVAKEKRRREKRKSAEGEEEEEEEMKKKKKKARPPGKENGGRAAEELAAARRRAAIEASKRAATRGGRSGGVGHGHGDVAAGSSGGNPLWNPARYVPPPPGAGGVSASDLTLSTDEVAEVRDVNGNWYPCNACLDTGNGGCTLIVRRTAIRMGLCDGYGNPLAGGRMRYVHVRGVVEGASEKVPTTTIEYRIKGKTMIVDAGITGAEMGCDLLVSRAEIARFEDDGFTLRAR
jgi:hypothetical protein